MSDLRIIEFRERAERGLDVPDLADIERRGRAMRHRRVVAAAGGLALVLVAGVGIARVTVDGGDAALVPATPASPTQNTSWDDGVRRYMDLGEEVLLPGPSEADYNGVAVRFEVPGEGWEWFGAGMGLRRTVDNPDDYGAAVFFLPDPSVRLRPCRGDRVQALGTDPDDLIANVAPLLDLAHSTVLQGPRLTTAFGGDAVHLRLQTNGACGSGTGPFQLRGLVNGSFADPGWERKHVLDLWHLVDLGQESTSLLVASWDLNGTEVHHEQQQALLESVRIDVS